MARAAAVSPRWSAPVVADRVVAGQAEPHGPRRGRVAPLERQFAQPETRPHALRRARRDLGLVQRRGAVEEASPRGLEGQSESGDRGARVDGVPGDQLAEPACGAGCVPALAPHVADQVQGCRGSGVRRVALREGSQGFVGAGVPQAHQHPGAAVDRERPDERIRCGRPIGPLRVPVATRAPKQIPEQEQRCRARIAEAHGALDEPARVACAAV